MNDPTSCDLPCSSPAALLNKECFCKTLDHSRLETLLSTNPVTADLLTSHPQLFSHTAVFITPQQFTQMQSIVAAVERVVQNPAYQKQVFGNNIGYPENHPAGVFMGFDFHLSDAGPKIIEINTNAGGGFLNVALLAAQTACCNTADRIAMLSQKQLEEEFIAMFYREWHLARGNKSLEVVAIVDENPQEQFLYPEFLLAQQLLQQAGITTLIVNSADLLFSDGYLQFNESKIDMVYNRLTDFSLSEQRHQALRQAYNNNAVVITPSPFHHALYADKRNLTILSDAEMLAQFGVNQKDIETLCTGIPRTRIVHSQNAEQLWQERKTLFFKPATGFGSRAAYRGDKITKRVWEEILQGDYVAQQQIPPSERGILVDEESTSLKLDIRAYVYNGKIQLLAARLYQGQTTNFRTQGGGFAPVFVI